MTRYYWTLLNYEASLWTLWKPEHQPLPPSNLPPQLDLCSLTLLFRTVFKHNKSTPYMSLLCFIDRPVIG
jgi:hypothetical protein